MDFEFLPKLPKSDLDDRTYKDLVDECVLRIPRYCPEWSNFNPSDPGITLIELFAWLTDQMLLRFNQVPRRNYVAFLELLGLKLQAATPAQAEITFYLSRPQSAQEPIPDIPVGAEIATERTETEEAVVFSTQQPLKIGLPRIRYGLTSALPEVTPDLLRDRFANAWTQDEQTGQWAGPEQFIFQNYPQVGNCFYLVFSAAEPLDGNVIELEIEGEPASSTGINPDHPPRCWEAWDGHHWQPVLRTEADDGTKGFSFSDESQAGGVGVKRAKITFHLPLNWPGQLFGTYHGRWLRCVYTRPQGEYTLRLAVLEDVSFLPQTGSALTAVAQVGSAYYVRIFDRNGERVVDQIRLDPSQDVALTQQLASAITHQSVDLPTQRELIQRIFERVRYTPTEDRFGYSRSPKFTRMVARTVGGTTLANQCMAIQDELLGESSGKPGQTFQLRSGSILPRTEEEQLLVQTHQELPQVWQEVNDFAESGPDDRHYTLDSLTGEIQFGPLIREPAHLAAEVRLRRQIQEQGAHPTDTDITTLELLEHQHGAVPPRGATIRMAKYRTGGGQKGNVQQEALRILKSALPYVVRVVNHRPALHGADAESLDEAVIRVPSLLRTRDRAVTAEDFETLTLQSSRAVARAYCPEQQAAGQISVVVVPQVRRDFEAGISPQRLQLTTSLTETVLDFLNERRLLGIDVQLTEPRYVGVSVQAAVVISPEYASQLAQQEIHQQLRSRLYRFLNPLTGGKDQKGWPFGQSVHKSDIMSLLQAVPGVQYVSTVQLFSLRFQDHVWERSRTPEDTVNPGPLGLICSWSDPTLRSGHVISLSS